MLPLNELERSLPAAPSTVGLEGAALCIAVLNVVVSLDDDLVMYARVAVDRTASGERAVSLE